MEYDIPLALIRQGILNFANYRTLIGRSFAFDGNDESQRLELCYTANYKNDINLQNGALFETNGVANTAHGVTSAYNKQIVFTGSPLMDPMVFSGTWYGGAGLKWNPTAASYVFVCSNAVSATTGRVDVASGIVKLVTGASFTALESLSVSTGAEFRVEADSGSGFFAKALTLAGGTAKGTYNITGLNALGTGSTSVAYASDRVNFTFSSCTNERPLAGSGTVKSDAPAQWRLSLTYNSNVDYGGNGRTNATVFTGNVSLYKTGDYPFAVNVTSTSTGTVQVAQGDLMFCANGSWPNCTNVVVSGGSLTLKNADAFGDQNRGAREKPKALWAISSGSTVNLDYTGRIKCIKVFLDGTKTSGGTYGAVGSGADHEYACLTGSGLLYVVQEGTAITIR